MKSNAIIRIILFSLAILILLGILAAGLSMGWLTAIFTEITETHTPAQTQNQNQNQTSPSPALPDPGNSGSDGADSTEPTDEPTVPTAEYIEIPANEVTDISIEWAAGEISIQPADVTAICIAETDYPGHEMVYSVKNGELKIKFGKESWAHVGFSFDFSKDLTILVPKAWAGREFELDGASATLQMQDMAFIEIDIDTASGECNFRNCVTQSLDVDTASGNIFFQGELNELDCDAASAVFTGELGNTPKRIEMDSASGDIVLTLPESSGFTVTLDALSGDFSSDFATVTQNGKYIAGDGSCRITVNAMSGDVTIYKG